MVEKLDFLEHLRTNMGDEMDSSMSDEITKVMDQQSALETEYADLVTLRGQLKGINNKHKLKTCKEDIIVSIDYSLYFKNQTTENHKQKHSKIAS